MKKVIGLCFALALAGCASGSGTTAAGLTEQAKKIQSYTKLACSFVPTIGTIANILSSGTIAPAIAIANDICSAVTTAPLADGPGQPKQWKVYGVPVKGKFVK